MKDVIASPFRQVLNIDEEKYAGDDDMMYIIRRLHSARKPYNTISVHSLCIRSVSF